MSQRRNTPVKKPAIDPQDALLARHSAGMIKRYVFPRGTVLFQKGDSRHCAYLIDKGEVRIFGNDEGGEDKLLCVLGEGEIFGEMALIEDNPRTATAVTATESEIFIIPRDALYERIKGLDPIIGLLIGLLIERYRITRIHLPESVKQDELGDFIEKLSRHERMPGEALRLNNIQRQRELALKEMKLEQELRAGLEHKEFIPYLQPIMHMPDRRLAGFEALIRWQHPEKGLLTPYEFIPVAERTGVIHNLDRLMLEKACAIIPQMKKHAGEDIFISVNLSGISFGALDVVETVSNTLERAKIDPSNINLEVTESALIGDPEAARQALAALKELGVGISLDDFGTGYSSLGYLHAFTFDALKIDRSFVSQLSNGRKSIDIVRAIVALARNFNLGIVAEGIEGEKEIEILNDLGCEMGQGYLFSKPLSVQDAYAYADAHRV
jgi:diguanylate cyclase